MDCETFGINHQYICVINDGKTDEDGMASCIISLLQKGSRTRHGQDGSDPYIIGMRPFTFRKNCNSQLDAFTFYRDLFVSSSRGG